MKRVLWIGIAVLGTATGGAARADESPDGAEHLENAKTALRELQYETARQHLLRARLSGNLDREELVAVHRFAGQVAAAFGKDDEAYDHYRRMLTLRPDATLPKGLAPKMVRPFERAQAYMHQRGRLYAHIARSSSSSVTVAVSSDPLQLAVKAELIYRDSGKRVHRSRASLRAGEASFPIKAAIGRRFRILALDEHGNQLDSVLWRYPAPEPATSRRAAPMAATRRTDTPATRDRPLYKRWYVWGLAAVGSGALALHFGRQADEDWRQLDHLIDNSQSYSFAEAKAMEESGRRNQLFTNASVAAAVGFGGVAAYLLFRGKSAGKARIVPSVGSGSASISLRGKL